MQGCFNIHTPPDPLTSAFSNAPRAQRDAMHRCADGSSLGWFLEYSRTPERGEQIGVRPDAGGGAPTTGPRPTSAPRPDTPRCGTPPGAPRLPFALPTLTHKPSTPRPPPMILWPRRMHASRCVTCSLSSSEQPDHSRASLPLTYAAAFLVTPEALGLPRPGSSGVPRSFIE